MRLPPWKYGPDCIYTPGSQTYQFFPLTGPISTDSWGKARASMLMDNSTGDTTIQAAVRYSNDGVAWDGAVGTGNTLTSDGSEFGDFAALPGTVKRFMQWGIFIKNTSTATDHELCWVYMNVDLRAC